MIEHKQLYYHKPEDGFIGDCFRTSVACILDLPRPDDVPHVMELAGYDREDAAARAHEILNDWLKQYDLKYIEFPLEASENTLQTYLAHYFKDMYVMVGCSSKHGGHSVVRKNGDYIWDPSRDNSGCIGPMSDGYYWIGLLVYHKKEN